MRQSQKFFYPKTMCIVGAFAKGNSIVQEMLKSIRNYGYTGKVFPVKK